MVTFIEEHSAQLLGTGIAVGSWIVLRLIIGLVVSRRLKISNFSSARRRMTVKSFNIVLNALFISALVIIWSVRQEEILLFLSSIVTVLGVAFFAQWSHLSNITSGVIIFFNTSTKIGDEIQIMDKDFNLQGEIFDIGLMFFKLRNTEGEIIALPNNIVLQKAIKTNAKTADKVGGEKESE